jgi:hypothetical protein
MPCVASRREAVLAHDRAHPAASLPRPAARLLAVMFATEDVCCVSQETLVEAGFVARQAGTSRIPDTYRLRALAIGEAP